MTPLSAAASAPSAPGSGARTDTSASGSRDDSAFAKALERRRAQGAEASRTREAPADAAESAPPGTDEERPDHDTLAPPAASAIVDTPATAPAWPPPGLAGLLGFPDAAAPSAPFVVDDAAPDAQPPQLGGAPQAAFAALPPAAATAPVVAWAALENADADAALPMPAPALETIAVADGGEPAPAAAFALPSIAALREPAPLLAAPLPAPEVGAEDFEARLGAQLEWMAEQKIGHARIRVSPNDLGPVEVRLQLDGDRIRAEFVAPQADTRQALEQGLPRLRDLLGEHGFQLAHAGVGSGHTGGRDGQPSPSSGAAGADAGGDGIPSHETAPRRATPGLLDAYA